MTGGFAGTTAIRRPTVKLAPGITRIRREENLAAPALAAVVRETHLAPTRKKTHRYDQSQNPWPGRRNRKKEEELSGEELEENAAEENGISNRHNHPTFISPLTKSTKIVLDVGLGGEIHAYPVP